MTMKIGALACFINKEMVGQHKLSLVKKTTLVLVKVINDPCLFLRLAMHETKRLEVTIGSHTNGIVFNVISSPTNPIIIGLSWSSLCIIHGWIGI